MHQPSDWYDRIEAENGQIVRILRAEWVDKRHGGAVYSVDVYKENDAGEAWSQNLYSSVWGGSCVAFPGLPRNEGYNGWYHDTSLATEEGYSALGRLSRVGWSGPVTQEDKELVCSFYPDFVYVCKKYKFTSRLDLMDKLRAWIPHHEVELILAAGFEKVAMNKSFWRLTEKNRKATCLFMRKNPQFFNLSLREIREAMTADSPVDYAEYLQKIPSYHRSTNNRAYYPCVSYEDFKYLKKQFKKYKPVYNDEKMDFNHLTNEYTDYIRMLYRSDHNCHDDYWRWPSDIQVFHDRLCEEERIKAEAERLAAEQKRIADAKKRSKELKQIEKKFRELNGEIDGYSIFVTSDYDEWQKQAKKLSQCICAAGYYQRMADGKCTLVFIQKDGIPQATAQVMPDGKIHQFYADERDRDNCLPSPAIKEAFNKWLESVPKSKFKKAKPRQRKSEKKEVAA